MGVQLNIKDERTVRLARELADATGRSVTETIREALEREHRELTALREERLRRMKAAVEEFQQYLPPEWKGKTSTQILREFREEDGSGT
ncbi:type II toxin-antitoxin system VapB family antitoxin [Sphingomonas lenta]|uniref:Protein transcription factor n=1 Tax=Sphingomonas lenta TaxID=1141887 RepID=A0A2A2SHI3_9SPHN|nr:type II toxin-antitoxin system VapB family antitoxin [Sphingomonas lenta]PAX08716.1 protein transcription factor [Sphingomonas lenta]